MPWRARALLLLALVGAACARPRPVMSPDLRRAASAVVVIQGPPPPGLQWLGEVVGFSCRRNFWGRGASMDGAMLDLRFEAAMRGATMVASVLCQAEGTSMSENCWRSFRCVGDAFRPLAP